MKALVKIIVYPNRDQAKWARTAQVVEVTSKADLISQLPDIIFQLHEEIVPHINKLGSKRQQVPTYDIAHYVKHMEV